MIFNCLKFADENALFEGLSPLGPRGSESAV